MELLLGALVGWAARKARRVGGRVDGHVDEVLDAGVDRLGELVAGKLGADPALVKLEAEAAAGEVFPRTRERVRLAVEDAAETDPDFAARLGEVLQQLQVAAAAASGAGGTTVLGGVSIRAEGGSAAAWSIDGPVTITPPASAPTPPAPPPPAPASPVARTGGGPPDPRGPGRP